MTKSLRCISICCYKTTYDEHYSDYVSAYSYQLNAIILAPVINKYLLKNSLPCIIFTPYWFRYFCGTHPNTSQHYHFYKLPYTILLSINWLWIQYKLRLISTFPIYILFFPSYSDSLLTLLTLALANPSIMPIIGSQPQN